MSALTDLLHTYTRLLSVRFVLVHSSKYIVINNNMFFFLLYLHIFISSDIVHFCGFSFHLLPKLLVLSSLKMSLVKNEKKKERELINKEQWEGETLWGESNAYPALLLFLCRVSVLHTEDQWSGSWIKGTPALFISLCSALFFFSLSLFFSPPPLTPLCLTPYLTLTCFVSLSTLVFFFVFFYWWSLSNMSRKHQRKGCKWTVCVCDSGLSTLVGLSTISQWGTFCTSPAEWEDVIWV